MPVDVIFERVGEGCSTDNGSARTTSSKQKHDHVSDRCNHIGVRHLRNIRLHSDLAFELLIRGESSTMDGSTQDTIDVKFNLASTDIEAWLKRGVEVSLDLTAS